ncbi:hypothetical protein GOODEAATRI_015652, partial [Goodea atripinnis]
DHWLHSNGLPASREELMITLADLDSIYIRTIYDNHMVSVALSHIVMDTTTVDFSTLGHAKDVEECKCPPGYTGLSCEMCFSGFERVPGGPYLGTCAGCNCDLCDECKAGFFHLSEANPDGCLRCFCMGVSSQCASSSWSRDQVQGGVNGQLFSLSNSGNTKTISEGIFQRGSSVVYRPLSSDSNEVYFWVLPESFRGDKVREKSFHG